MFRFGDYVLSFVTQLELRALCVLLLAFVQSFPPHYLFMDQA